MSPQMNGEPRDTALGGAEQKTARSDRRSSPHEAADLPLPQAINAESVTRTTVARAETDAKTDPEAREDAKLAPLFSREAALDFRSRWDLVQRGFVDDPREAVHAADELVTQVTENLAQTFANQRAELEKGLEQAEAPTTESLRIALRHYRSFFERLLSI